jgi:NitT/TauT family transport system substrate-binding protein
VSGEVRTARRAIELAIASHVKHQNGPLETSSYFMKIALALFLTLICSATTIADAQNVTAPTLRVGSTLNDSNAEGFYASESGFFHQAGLNVEMTTFNNGDAAAAALAAGAIDISIQPPMQIAQGVARGISFTIIGAGALNTVAQPSAMIMVSKTSTINTARDLVGKTIAINALKSSSENLLDAWLAKSGADPTKIRIIELPSAQMAPALERGTVDAVEIFEPAFTVAMKRGNVRVLANPTDGMRNPYLQTAWYTTKQFAAQNPELLKKFVTVIYQTARWANAHHLESGAILARLSKLDPDIAGSMGRIKYAESLQVADLLPELDNGFKFGLLPRVVTTNELLARLPAK